MENDEPVISMRVLVKIDLSYAKFDEILIKTLH